MNFLPLQELPSNGELASHHFWLLLSKPIFKTHFTPPWLLRMCTTALWVFQNLTQELHNYINETYLENKG